MKKVLIVNGPNLSMLGKRDPKQYGTCTLHDVEEAVKSKADELGIEVSFFQSECEGALISAIHEAMSTVDGIVINAGAYTHYSYAILDALSLTGLPIMEIHLSDIHSREPFRDVSVIAPACVGQICGLGLASYTVGLEKLWREYLRDGVPAPMPMPVDAKKTEETDLLAVRDAISATDSEIDQLLLHRLSLSRKVAAAKATTGKAVRDEVRENEIIERTTRHMQVKDRAAIASLERHLMRTSRAVQYELLSGLSEPTNLQKQIDMALESNAEKIEMHMEIAIDKHTVAEFFGLVSDYNVDIDSLKVEPIREKISFVTMTLCVGERKETIKAYLNHIEKEYRNVTCVGWT